MCGSTRANISEHSRSRAVAVLLQPILDELQHYRAEGGGDRRLVDEYFYAVTKKQGHFADEALALGGSNDLNGIEKKEVIMRVMKVVFMN